MTDQRYTPSTASVDSLSTPTAASLAGPAPLPIGGWLYLVAIGLVITPLRVGAMLATELAPIFTNGTWQQLTTPGGAVYHPLWGPFLVFELVGNLVLCGLGVFALFHFFRRTRKAPRLVIAVYGFALVFVTLDNLFTSFIPVAAEHADSKEAMQVFVRSAIAAGIWIPYFLFSERVKKTFTR